MIIIKKEFKLIKKILIMPGILFKQIFIIYKNKFLVIKYKIKNKKIKLGNNIKFNQKTILSGKGVIDINNNVSIGYKMGGFFWNGLTEIQARYPKSKVIIYDNVAFNNSNCIMAANSIEIKQDCRIGANVTMMDFEAHGTHSNMRNQVGEIGRIIIGKNVWIGNNVIILKNVSIGDNSIIAAGSVIRKGNYPANCIIGGNPAKIIKYIK